MTAPTPEIQAQILGFIVFLLPLTAGLWKIFSSIQSIESKLLVNIQSLESRLKEDLSRQERYIRNLENQLHQTNHKSELAIARYRADEEKMITALNAMKELFSQLQTTNAVDLERIKSRISQVEQYLIKSTSYQSRE